MGNGRVCHAERSRGTSPGRVEKVFVSARRRSASYPTGDIAVLTIRKEQMDVFNQHMLSRFVRNVLADLKRTFPAKCKEQGDDAVQAAIRDGIQRAQAHGVTIEYDVERFIFLMYFLDPLFDRDPRIRGILSDPGFDGRGRMDKACAFAEETLGVPKGKWPSTR